MQIVHSDRVIPVAPPARPDYDADNPVWKLSGLIERIPMAAELDCYDMQSLQFLFPIKHLDLYGPSGSGYEQADPRLQDHKEDFQKQNIRDFTVGNTYLTRGYAYAGQSAIPFLKLSYNGGLETRLSLLSSHSLGNALRLYIKVGDAAHPTLINVPYNPVSGRFDVELWGFAPDLYNQLGKKGKQSIDAGAILSLPDLIKGTQEQFERERTDDKKIVTVEPGSLMHPTNPLYIEVAWADSSETFWDSNEGRNYRYCFNMALRGWNNYLTCGYSDNPHGGVGTLEFRNLFSNYFGHNQPNPELSRNLQPWSFDAMGNKGATKTEPFLAVEYMDLHILQPGCCIGLHRHRDNQEVFLLMEGKALMIIGDWNQFDDRVRCFEARYMRKGDLALCKTGQLHALINTTDEKNCLFMFGGYD